MDVHYQSSVIIVSRKICLSPYPKLSKMQDLLGIPKLNYFWKISVFLHLKHRINLEPICKYPRKLFAWPQKTFSSVDLARPFSIKTYLILESAVLLCEESVLSRNPCEKKTCPNGPNGRYEMVFDECPGIPEFCPMSVKNNSATCCPEKCGKGKKQQKDKETHTNQSTDRPTKQTSNHTRPPRSRSFCTPLTRADLSPQHAQSTYLVFSAKSDLATPLTK